MNNCHSINDPKMLKVFVSLLKKRCFSSQLQLEHAMADHGYEQLNQTKISRIIMKVGAMKIANVDGSTVYVLPKELTLPDFKQPLSSLVLEARHNNMQIILSTYKNSAEVIASIIKSVAKSIGILGLIAKGDTIFIAPEDTRNINSVMKEIKHLLTFNYD